MSALNATAAGDDAAARDPTCVLRDVTLGRGVRFWSFVNLYGCTIGDETRIGTFVEVQKGARIGARCKISSHTFICEGVEIADEVFVGHGVTFTNDKHPRATTETGALQGEADWRVIPTRVGRRASIGSGATILCGITIGEGAVVGAGAVVTRDVPPGVTVVGNPARPLRPAPPAQAQAGVPAFDLTRQVAALRPQLMAALEEVLTGCTYTLGPQVERFERAFAATLGVREVVAVNSGTSALHLALLAAGVGPGDEVITTPWTFIATAWAISYCGARPVLVDVEEDTLTIDPQAVARAVTPRTRAVIPVHIYGQTARMAPLLALCAERGLTLIEDAAQAHGATCDGRLAGSMGRLACFSFYPSKNLGAAGEGGAVATDDPELARAVRALRDHAQPTRGVHERVGFNYRMEGFQGAVLGVKLPHLAAWNARRREIAGAYLRGLAGLSGHPQQGLRPGHPEQGLRPGLRLPAEAPGRTHVWHQFVVRHPRRDELRQALAARGIGTALHYARPVHLQPAYAELGLGPGSLPVAEQAAAEVLSLPMFPELREDEVARVIEAVRACLS